MAKKKHRREGIAKEVGDYLVYVMVLAMVRFVRFLPLNIALRLGKIIALIFFYIDGWHRKIALSNLALAFGNEKSSTELWQLAKRSYTNMGKSMMEFCRLPKLNKENLQQYVTFSGLDNYLNAFKQNKGVLIITAHFGNWELLAAACSLAGYDGNALARPQNNKYLERLVNHYRSLFGNRVIAKKNGLREVIRCLKRGEMVGILIDQNVSRSEGIFVNFFGRPASTVIAPALIARKLGVPVIPTFIIRQAGGTHKIVFEKAVRVTVTVDMDQDLQVNTQRFTSIVEAYVKRYPEQWFWVHRRWKTQPKTSSN